MSTLDAAPASQSSATIPKVRLYVQHALLYSGLTFFQGKTKAKQRYLKAKRERRKKRKTTAGAPTGAQKPRAPSPEDEDSDSSEGESISPTLNDDTDVHADLTPRKEDARPRKKRKISATENPEERHEQDEEVRIHSQAGPENTISSSPLRTPTPIPALASFPLPRQPDAPSKTTLALQGLDKALVEAEIIDPRRIVPLSSTGSDDNANLSERTRKRLHDLGITELFAGLFPKLTTQK